MYGLDGNAIAGTLVEVFGEELTAKLVKCAQCGWISPMAEASVYLDGPGIVTRCRHCDNVLLVIVDRRGVRCIDMMGIASMESPSPLA